MVAGKPGMCYKWKQTGRRAAHSKPKLKNNFGFDGNTADSCVILSNQSGNKLILALYIDDGHQSINIRP